MRELRVSVRSFISWIRCSIRIVGTVCDGMNGKRAENPVPPLARAAPDITYIPIDAARPREPRPGCGPRRGRGGVGMRCQRADRTATGRRGPRPGAAAGGGWGARHARHAGDATRDNRTIRL